MHAKGEKVSVSSESARESELIRNLDDEALNHEREQMLKLE